MTWKFMLWSLGILGCALKGSFGVALPATNASQLWKLDSSAFSNGTQLSIPLPDQQHLTRFSQLKIEAFLPQHFSITCAAVDLAYFYLYVLDQLWQNPAIYVIDGQLTFTTDDPQLPLRVVFRESKAATMPLTTEHAAWALVDILRKFRQDKSIAPESVWFKAYAWEVSVKGVVIGLVDTILDEKTVGSANGTVGGTVNETSVEDSHLRRLGSSTSFATSKRDTNTSTTLNLPTISDHNKTNELSTLHRRPAESPPINISVEYTSRTPLYPRDIADLMQFLTTVLMEHRATDPVRYDRQSLSFDDDYALSRPLRLTFYTGSSVSPGKGGPTPSWWNVTYADLVHGVRQIVLKLMREKVYKPFIADIVGPAGFIAVMEVAPLKQAGWQGRVGGGDNVTEIQS